MGIKKNRIEPVTKSAPGLCVHQAVLALNQGFTQVADSLERLERLDVFEGSHRLRGFVLPWTKCATGSISKSPKFSTIDLEGTGVASARFGNSGKILRVVDYP